MPKIKQEPVKSLSVEEQKQIEALEKEYDKVLDLLFDCPDDRKALERIGWIEKKILDIKGEKPLDVNDDFRK
nr:MAG TPA: hypothetical protein [Caudoviricetes sp.]